MFVMGFPRCEDSNLSRPSERTKCPPRNPVPRPEGRRTIPFIAAALAL
jgi:hypothetical protein